MTVPGNTGIRTGDGRCPYCGQIQFDPDGNFECGGEGDGICSYWIAIEECERDLDLGIDITNLDAWLDNWIQSEMGMTWKDAGWDRAAHAHAVRTELGWRLQ